MNVKRLLFAVLLVAVIITAGMSAQAVQYQIVDLGLGWATGINDSEQVVGYSVTSGGFLWQNGEMTDLDFGASVINDNGQVAGTSPISGNSEHALLWQNGSIIDRSPWRHRRSFRHER